MFTAAILLLSVTVGADAPSPTVARAEIRIRDPFVLPVAEEQTYYLYGTNSREGFDAYRSTDLDQWQGPFPVLRPPADFWGTKLFWAPEVHRYQGRYYLFGTFTPHHGLRGTQVCVSDSPRGPFVPVGDGPQTPEGWQCLDGTLYVDRGGRPWMVFCHEWEQVVDGGICAVRLALDLARSESEPTLLFRASEAPWVGVKEFGGRRGYITDGPFLLDGGDGSLLMLWSSFGKPDGPYALAVARSPSGRLEGPWEQSQSPLISDDGGHGMLFTTFDGRTMLAFHRPNRGPERPVFLEVEVSSGRIHLKEAAGK